MRRFAAGLLAALGLLGACARGADTSWQDASAALDGGTIDEERVQRLRETLTPEDPLLLLALQSLVWKHHAEGRLIDARRVQEEILALLRRLSTSPRADLKIGWMARNISYLLLAQGDPAEALPYTELSVSILERCFPQEDGHPDLALSLGLRGMILTRVGRFDDAEKMLRRAASLFEAHQDQYPLGNDRLVECRTALGTLLGLQGRTEQGLAELARAGRELAKREVAGRDPSSADQVLTAGQRVALGHLLIRAGRADEAIAALSDAVRRLRSLRSDPSGMEGIIPSVGSRTLDLALAEQLLGGACILAGKPDRAVAHLRAALRVEALHSARILSRAGEAEAGNYIDTYLQTWRLLYSPWIDAGYPTADLHPLLAGRKSILSRFLQARKGTATGGDLAVQQVRLAEIGNLLGGAILVSDAAADRAEHQRRISDLQAEKAALERTLARQEPLLASLLDPDAVAGVLPASLPEGTAFVDFYAVRRIRTGRGEPDSDDRYVAFIVSRGRTTLVDLGAREATNARIEAWRRSLIAGAPGAASPMAASLGKQLWEPLAQRFGAGVDRVILCPDGMLALVPWSALQGPGGRVGEDYCVSLVAHPSELSGGRGIDARSGTGEGTFLGVGDVNYADPAEASGAVAAGARGPTQTWEYLHQSRDELREVLGIARAAGKDVRDPLEQSRASTRRVLQRLPSARWAHFSTHGFVADDEHRRSWRMTELAFARNREMPAWLRTTAVERNPLSIVGLVMAGANRPRAMDARGVPIDDGGILSGAAIAALDLRRSSLVVLSACDTTRGLHSYGEGVFGLARAFHVAGARQVVATLWKVNEGRTRELLQLFYAGYFEEGLPAARALQKAQKELDRRLRAEGGLPRDPAYYWAGLYVYGS